MKKLTGWLIILVALHSYAVAFVLFFFPEWGLRLGGWEGLHPLFFVRQAGAFHFVLATAYLIEHFRYRGIFVLVIAKFCAALFLLAVTVVAREPWLVPFAGATDFLMGLVVLLVYRAARRVPAGD